MLAADGREASARKAADGRENSEIRIILGAARGGGVIISGKNGHGAARRQDRRHVSIKSRRVRRQACPRLIPRRPASGEAGPQAPETCLGLAHPSEEPLL